MSFTTANAPGAHAIVDLSVDTSSFNTLASIAGLGVWMSCMVYIPEVPSSDGYILAACTNASAKHFGVGVTSGGKIAAFWRGNAVVETAANATVGWHVVGIRIQPATGTQVNVSLFVDDTTSSSQNVESVSDTLTYNAICIGGKSDRNNANIEGGYDYGTTVAGVCYGTGNPINYLSAVWNSGNFSNPEDYDFAGDLFLTLDALHPMDRYEAGAFSGTEEETDDIDGSLLSFGPNGAGTAGAWSPRRAPYLPEAATPICQFAGVVSSSGELFCDKNMVSGTVTVEALAFHNIGVDRVILSVSDGTTTLTQTVTTLTASAYRDDLYFGERDIDSHTTNRYAGTGRASGLRYAGVYRADFDLSTLDDGDLTITARAEHDGGTFKEISWGMVNNSGSTRSTTEYYIDGTAGNDSNPGTEASPKQTIPSAFDYLRTTHDGDDSIIFYCRNIDTDDIGMSVGTYDDNTIRPIIKPWPGSDASSVVIDPKFSSFRLGHARFENVTIDISTFYFSWWSGLSSDSTVELVNCKIISDSPQDSTAIGNYNNRPSSGGLMIHGCTIDDAPIRPLFQKQFTRNVRIRNTSVDMIRDCEGIIMAVDAVNSRDPSGTRHPDAIQVDASGDNIIYYNVSMLDCDGQGVFFRAPTVTNVALVNILCQQTTDRLYMTQWDGDPTSTYTHIVVRNMTLPNGNILWADEDITAANISFDSLIVNDVRLDGISGSVGAVHSFEPASGSWTDRSAVYSDYTSSTTNPFSDGAVGDYVSDEIDYTPTLAAVLSRIASPAVPFDLNGEPVPTDGTAALGALQVPTVPGGGTPEEATTSAFVANNTGTTLSGTFTLPSNVWPENDDALTINNAAVRIYSTKGYGAIGVSAVRALVNESTPTQLNVEIDLDRTVYTGEPVEIEFDADFIISDDGDSTAAASLNVGMGGVLVSPPSTSNKISSGRFWVELNEATTVGWLVDGTMWAQDTGTLQVVAFGPDETTNGGSVVNGAMLNPNDTASARPGRRHGLDERLDEYDASLKLDLSSAVSVSANDCIIKVRSADDPQSPAPSSSNDENYIEAWMALHITSSSVSSSVLTIPCIGYDGSSARPQLGIDTVTALLDLSEHTLSESGLQDDDSAAVTPPATADVIERFATFDLSRAITWVTVYRNMLPRGFTSGDGYGFDRAGTIGAALLKAVAEGTSEADRLTLAQWIVIHGAQLFFARDELGEPLGPNGGHNQGYLAMVTAALRWTGNADRIPDIGTVLDMNETAQPFRWTQALVDSIGVPNTMDDSAESLTELVMSKTKTITAVNGDEVDAANLSTGVEDQDLYSGGGAVLVRISDDAEFTITDYTRADNRFYLDDAGDLQVNDTFYVKPAYTRSVNDIDWSNSHPNEVGTNGSEYRGLQAWTAQWLFLKATGMGSLLDTGSLSHPFMEYVPAANADDVPGASYPFPKVHGTWGVVGASNVPYEEGMWNAHAAELGAELATTVSDYINDSFDAPGVTTGMALNDASYVVDGDNNLGVADNQVYTFPDGNVLEVFGVGYAAPDNSNLFGRGALISNLTLSGTTRGHVQIRFANNAGSHSRSGIILGANDDLTAGVIVGMVSGTDPAGKRWVVWDRAGNAEITGGFLSGVADNNDTDISYTLTDDGLLTLSHDGTVILDRYDVSDYLHSDMRVGLEARRPGGRINEYSVGREVLQIDSTSTTVSSDGSSVVLAFSNGQTNVEDTATLTGSIDLSYDGVSETVDIGDCTVTQIGRTVTITVPVSKAVLDDSDDPQVTVASGVVSTASWATEGLTDEALTNNSTTEPGTESIRATITELYYGLGVTRAARSYASNGIFLDIGDSFSFNNTNRLPAVAMLDSQVAGPIVGWGVGPTHTVTSNPIFTSTQLNYIAIASEGRADASSYVLHNNTQPFRRAAGSGPPDNEFGTGVPGPGVWAPRVNWALDETLSTAFPDCSPHAEWFRTRILLSDLETRATPSVPLASPTASQDIRVRVCGVTPPSARNNLDLIMVNVGHPDGNVPSTTYVAPSDERASGTDVSAASSYQDPAGASLDSPTLETTYTETRFRRIVFAVSQANGDILIDRDGDGDMRLNSSGEIELACRLASSDLGQAVTTPSVSTFTAFLSNSDGTIPQGIIRLAPLSMSSASYFNLSDANPDDLNTTGSKTIHASNFRDYVAAHVMDGRPFNIFVHFAAEQNPTQGEFDRMFNFFRLGFYDGSTRIPNLSSEVNIVFVLPFLHNMNSSTETFLHGENREHVSRLKAAIDNFNATYGSAGFAAGYIDLYSASGGNTFDNSAEPRIANYTNSLVFAQNWLDANGFSSINPPDLLDGDNDSSGLHLDSNGALVMGTLVNKIMSSAASGGSVFTQHITSAIGLGMGF